MSILVINAGSSSLKFSLFEADRAEASATGVIDWKSGGAAASLILQRPGAEPQRRQAKVENYASAVRQALRLLQEAGLPTANPMRAVGHRVVHGGADFRSSVLIDASVKAAIGRLSALAPLHNPPALEAIQAAETALPGVPQAAVFDTAFHVHLPASAFLYPLPYEWYTSWGIRRFGFHGISFAYCTGRTAELLGRPATDLRLVICHLGNGCSAAAVRGGVSVATTMGFTPMEGLMMGTRCGSVDPGVLLHVQRTRGLSVEELATVLNHQSGLLGVSGVSSDFRAVEAAAQRGHERARLALALYAERIRSTIGALAVTLGGLDALVFTAGVGENAVSLRATVCAGLECLGVTLDAERNATRRPDTDISTVASRSRILVIHTREGELIAREIRRLLAGQEDAHGVDGLPSLR